MKLKLTELTEKITPLPYRIESGKVGLRSIVGDNDRRVCTMNRLRVDERHSDAAYLVHCANTLPKLVEALERIFSGSDDLFQLATDSIVHSSDGSWSCKSCGMELDSGGGHSDACCASAILDLAVPLHAAEAALTLAREVEP